MKDMAFLSSPVATFRSSFSGHSTCSSQRSKASFTMTAAAEFGKSVSSIPHSNPTAPPRAPAALSVFRDYFHAMTGQWNSERTYHYMTEQSREDSQTTFDVTRLTRPSIDKVLESNGEAAVFSPQEQAYSEGFSVGYLTKMESQKDLVRSSTNLAFVPRNVSEDGVVTGDYYRDLGYEEAGPVKAKFMFDSKRKELNMTTYYTRVVSVDQITLVNPSLRLRKIVNYARPSLDTDPLVNAVLVGFGIECKGSERLVQ